MNRRSTAVLVLAAALSLSACGSSNQKTAGTGGSGGEPGTGGNGNGNAGAGGSGGAGGAPGGGMLPSGVQLGTYIVLGDSISDRGGTGPFFYDSLDTDLKAKFPSLMYVHAAQGGAITDAYTGELLLSPTLAKQVAGLANNYPGDVLVTITIGGNDLQFHAADVISGADQALRDQFAAHLDAQLATLTTPGRLGTGKVYIVLANIYDFTDGQGNFKTVNCAPPGVSNVAADYDKKAFAAWNSVSSTSLDKVKGFLYDMHADFAGHGYNNTNAADVWYDSASCIHPNAKGHDAIRRSIYKIVTGETLP